VLLFLLAHEAGAATELLELYMRAREYDPVFQQARLERDISLQGMREARSGVFPTMSADLDFSDTDQDVRESDNFLFTEGDSDYSSRRFTVSLTQPIYRAEVLRRLPQSRAEVRRAEAQYLAAEQDLMVRLAQAWFNALASRDNLEFATAERAAIERQLQQSEQRLGSGLGTITDVHEARARFGEAQAKEVEAENTLADARMILVEITGEYPEELRSLSETFPMVEPDRSEVDAWVRTALFQNLTLTAREEQVTVAEQEIKVQKAARMPRLDLVASFSESDSGGSQFTGTGEGTEIRNTELAFRLGIPVFDGGAWSARARAAVLRHQISLQELERDRRRVERETRSAFNGVVGGVTRVNALNQAVFSQERALESKEEGFRAGLETGLAVLDARRDLYYAKSEFAQARYIYILNTLRLKKSTGALDLQDLRAIDNHLE
jgi:outer membrane protein